MGELFSYQEGNETYVRPPDVEAEERKNLDGIESEPNMTPFADHVSNSGYHIVVDHNPYEMHNPEAYRTIVFDEKNVPVQVLPAVSADIFFDYGTGDKLRVLRYSEETEGEAYFALKLNVRTGVYALQRGAAVDTLRPFSG